MPVYKARVKVVAGYGDRKIINARVEAKNPTDAKRRFELMYGNDNIASTLRQER